MATLQVTAPDTLTDLVVRWVAIVRRARSLIVCAVIDDDHDARGCHATGSWA